MDIINGQHTPWDARGQKFANLVPSPLDISPKNRSKAVSNGRPWGPGVPEGAKGSAAMLCTSIFPIKSVIGEPPVTSANTAKYRLLGFPELLKHGNQKSLILSPILSIFVFRVALVCSKKLNKTSNAISNEMLKSLSFENSRWSLKLHRLTNR